MFSYPPPSPLYMSGDVRQPVALAMRLYLTTSKTNNRKVRIIIISNNLYFPVKNDTHFVGKHSYCSFMSVF